MPNLLLDKIKELKSSITGAVTGAVSNTAEALNPSTLMQNATRFASALAKNKKI